jgi:hypothetical protein
MRRQKLKARNIDTDNANRTAAASSFKKGDRIRYVATGQEGAFLEVHEGFAAPECWVQFDDCSIPVSVDPLQLKLVCSASLTASPELAPSLMPQSFLEESTPPNSLKLENSNNQSCDRTLKVSPSMTTSKLLTEQQEVESLTLSAPECLVPPSPKLGSNLPPPTSEICSPTLSDSSSSASLNGSSSKMSPDCLMPPSTQEQNQEHSLDTYCGSFPAAGTWGNGLFSVQPALDCHTVAKGSLSLPTPTALSSINSRPPGQNKLEVKLKQLGLIAPGETVNPELLEAMLGFPLEWTSVEECKEEGVLPVEDEKPLETPSASPPPLLPCDESSTSTASYDKRSLGEESLISLDSDYGKMEELVPGRSLATDAGAEITAMDTSAMDNSTMSSTADAAKNSPLAQLASLEVLEELTLDEERDRHHLELKVERAFYEAGKALAEIRDRRLYRSTHKTFEEYCRDRFGYTRRNVNYTIAAAAVVENLCTNGTQNGQEDLGKNLSQNGQEDLGKNRTQILPTNMEQVRHLTQLEPDEQRQVWEEAVEEAGGKVPSGRVVKGIVERLKEKPLHLASDFCKPGDIFTLVRLEGKEKKYNGYSCVAVATKDFTVVVETHNEVLTVKPDNLNKIDSPDARRELPQILVRIKRLRSKDELLDRFAYTTLDHLGRQTYLTSVEDKVLRLLEEEYGTLEE